MVKQDEEIVINKNGNRLFDYNPIKGGKLLNAKEMSIFAGVSEVSFYNSWIKQGCPSIPDPRKPSRTVYLSAAVMKWRFDKDIKAHDLKITGEIEKSHDSMTAVEADRRKKQADALLSELKLSKELELVANIDDLMSNFGDAVGHVTATLLGWRANLTGLLTMQDESSVDKVLDDEVTRLLQALKAYSQEYKNADE